MRGATWSEVRGVREAGAAALRGFGLTGERLRYGARKRLFEPARKCDAPGTSGAASRMVGRVLEEYVRVLGVDPGLSRCGIGIVEGNRRRARVVKAGVIRTDPEEAIPRRLSHLYVELQTLIADTRPDAVAVERVFFTVNVRTAMGVGQAAGVAMLAAAQADIRTFEYTPTRMKAVVAGSGNADKHQVAYMVRTHLRLAEAPSPPDAADALALALCHLWEAPGHDGSPTGRGKDAGMSPRLEAAIRAAGPGAQVVNSSRRGGDATAADPRPRTGVHRERETGDDHGQVDGDDLDPETGHDICHETSHETGRTTSRRADRIPGQDGGEQPKPSRSKS